MIHALAKRAARSLLGDYAIYCIYRNGPAGNAGNALQTVVEVDAERIRSSADPLIAEQAGYAGDGSRAFAIDDAGALQAVCFYWHGARYRGRGFWPLRDDEAKLVQLVTTTAARGRGLASALIAGSTRALLGQPWSALYARIWHSNEPSLRAFERAGWRRIALVVEINPLRLHKPWRLRLPLPTRQRTIDT